MKWMTESKLWLWNYGIDRKQYADMVLKLAHARAVLKTGIILNWQNLICLLATAFHVSTKGESFVYLTIDEYSCEYRSRMRFAPKRQE